MAQWGDLSAEQQTQVSNWMDQLLRPWAGHIARTLYELDVVKAAYLAGDDSVFDIVGTLDADAVIPNASGLSGAIDIRKDELAPVLTALNNLLTDYYGDADKQRYVALAGGPNVIGG